jgi:predicted metal-dependent peptidase
MADEMKLSPEEKLIRAKIRLGADPPEGRPFFSFLVSHLKFRELKQIPTIGVSDFGECVYNPEFVDKLPDNELYGVLCHEVLHVALEHMKREREMQQNHLLSNIAQDIVVNNILSADGIKLPETGLVPKGNELMVFGYQLKKIDTKCSEEIYDELYKHHKKQLEEMIKQASKGRFDEHMKGEGGQGEGEGEREGKDGKGDGSGLGKDILKQDWKKVLLDACAYAKNRGCVPAGMERIIGKIMEPKVNWRTYLLKFITSMIPTDYTWARPSKRTISTGVYFPSVEKESIEIIAWIDTSGSISEEDLKKFMGELVGITRCFKNVDLTVGVCDCAIHGVFTFRNATVGDVMNKIKLKGGGGTSHVPVFKWLKKERPNAKFVICFTDGYTEFPTKKPSIDTLWVVAGENRIEKEAFPFGKVVVVK